MVNKVYTLEEVKEATIKYFDGDSLAADVWINKYALRNVDGELVEKTPTDMHHRLAKEFARIEQKYPNPMSEEEIFSLLKDFKYIVPQGSPMSAIGNDNFIQSLSNCFTIAPPEDSYGGICFTDQEMVQLMKRRGGVGFDISKLRPKGMVVRNAAKTTDGIGCFMERFSNSTRECAQSGRRGALMTTIDIRHPEIETFINIKKDLKKVTGANISIRISDEFMKAVMEDKPFLLHWPVDAKTEEEMKFTKIIQAKELWDNIIESAHGMAEPGLLFWDTIINNSPADSYASVGFQSTSVNPCCFEKGSRVMVVTDSGIKKLEEITNEDLVWVDVNNKWEKTSGYFDAGEAEIYEVSLSNGDTFNVTENHKFLKRLYDKKKRKLTGNVLTETKDLKVGERIVANIKKPLMEEWGGIGTYNEGLLLGWLSGDGTLGYSSPTQTHPSTILSFWGTEYDVAEKLAKVMEDMGYENKLYSNKQNKARVLKSNVFTRDFTEKYEDNIWKFKSHDQPNEFLYKASKEFVRGFISAYFSADGTVACNHVAKNYNIQVASINKARLYQFRDLLCLFGVKCAVSLMRKGGLKDFGKARGGIYKTKDCWRITITGRDNIEKFHKEIGFVSDLKYKKVEDLLSTYVPGKSKTVSDYYKITNIKKLYNGEKKKVGCIEVENSHMFTANGIVSGNSEIVLSNYDSCRLLLLNTTSYVENPYIDKASFDYVKFRKHSEIAQRLMDDLVDLEIEKIDKIIEKINNDDQLQPVKKIELDLWEKVRNSCIRGRRTGLGVTGIGDTLASLNIVYGSDESIKVVDRIYGHLCSGSYESSIRLAEERGSFPLFDLELEKGNNFVNKVVWEMGNELRDIYVSYGRRNIANLTTAPAGSLSLLTQTTSGIEPAFRLEYMRRRRIYGDEKYDFVDEMGDKWEHYTVLHKGLEKWKEANPGKDQKESVYYKSTSDKIDWKSRVKLQGAAQEWIDHAISSTCNLPKDVTKETVSDIYVEAWKEGCKGFTVYRDGCRAGVLVTKEEDGKEKQDNSFSIHEAPTRPEVLTCDIHRARVKKQDYTILVGLYEGKPYEIFAGMSENIEIPSKYDKGKLDKVTRKTMPSRYDLQIGENGDGVKIKDVAETFKNPDYSTACRLLSCSLRHGTPPKYITEQLKKDSNDSMDSFNKVVARVLKKYITEGDKSGDRCPECKEKSMIYQEGCCLCVSCGYTACS